jgi:hypothetical protein
MAEQPIGISFIPSAQNQQNGPANLRADGGLGAGSTDLSQAYKILSLRLPTVVGAQAPVAPSLLTSQGSAALPNGMNSSAALFTALIKSMLGITSNPAGSPMGGASSMALPSAGMPSGMDTGRVVPSVRLNEDGANQTRDTSTDPVARPDYQDLKY